MEDLKSIRLTVVAVCYYLRPKDLEKNIDLFVRSMGCSLGCVRLSYVTLRPGGLSECPPGSKWTTCKDTYFDMSGYARGIAAVGATEGLTLFVNDTLFIKHPWRRIAKSLRAWLGAIEAVGCPVAVGAVHWTGNFYGGARGEFDGRHVSTFAFLLNASASTIFTALLRDALRDDARKWLDDLVMRSPFTRNVIDFHLRLPLNPNSWAPALPRDLVSEEMKLRKAATVAIEIELSRAVLEGGGILIPVNRGLRFVAAVYWAALCRRVRALFYWR